MLLAFKKRGFGEGKWTGIGGKPEPGETIDQTAVRETEEEIGVTPLDLRHVATLDFIFPDQPRFAGWSMQVFVYLAEHWIGEPSESEEVAPRWFPRDALPYPGMWSDAAYWLPPCCAATPSGPSSSSTTSSAWRGVGSTRCDG